jgi:histidine triad (HIT) family protein
MFIAFLDINPLRLGHVLVVPRSEVDYIFDNDTATLSQLMLFAQPIAAAIKKTIPCNRIGIAVIGLEVPHAHMHLVPIDTANDLNFTQPKLKPTPETLADIATKIKSNLHSAN